MKKPVTKRSTRRRHPSLHSENKNFEAAVKALPENALEEHLTEILKDYEFLDDVPSETKKKEASKPMYLIRYE